MPRIGLVVIPLSYIAVSTAAASILPRLEYEHFPQYAHGIAVSSAQAFLSAAASGMMALTGIAFSLAFLIIQFSGAAYSPRLFSWFARDPVIFHALGLFIATFVYALGTLAWVDRDKNGYVPLFSTYLVLSLLLGSMILLVRLVLKAGQLGITNVLRFVGAKGRRVIETSLPPLQAVPSNDEFLQWDFRKSQPPSQIVYYHGEPKTVVCIDFPQLTCIAENVDAIIVLHFSIGDTLADGMALFAVHDAEAPVPERTLTGTLDLGYERSVDHDAKYAFRLLVDIAIKALSPAVNDPTTAVQVLDQIEDLLSRLAHRQLDPGEQRDERGVLRVLYPHATWEDYLELAFDEIRLCGASQIQVMRRLRAALDGVLAASSGSRADAVRRYVQHLDANLESSVFDPADRTSARRDDRQGIGVTR